MSSLALLSDALRPLRLIVAMLLKVLFGDAESRVPPGWLLVHKRVNASVSLVGRRRRPVAGRVTRAAPI